MQNFLPLLVFEVHVLQNHFPAQASERHRAPRVRIFRLHFHQLARAFQSRHRLRQLRSDTDHLKDRRNEQAEENGVLNEGAERHASGNNLARSKVHDERAHET